MAYTPTLFQKGSVQRTARTISEDVYLVFSGWTRVGDAPPEDDDPGYVYSFNGRGGNVELIADDLEDLVLTDVEIQELIDEAIDVEAAARIKGDAAPLVTKRTLGDITLANTGAVFEDLDNSGTPNARNLDIVFPDVVAGQVVELELNCLVSNGAGNTFLTCASIVNGAVVNMIHGTNTGGVAAWFCPASVFSKVAGSVPYTLQAGDIENGNARFRVRYKSTQPKAIYANSTTTYTLVVIGRGPKG